MFPYESVQALLRKLILAQSPSLTARIVIEHRANIVSALMRGVFAQSHQTITRNRMRTNLLRQSPSPGMGWLIWVFPQGFPIGRQECNQDDCYRYCNQQLDIPFGTKLHSVEKHADEGQYSHCGKEAQNRHGVQLPIGSVQLSFGDYHKIDGDGNAVDKE